MPPQHGRRFAEPIPGAELVDLEDCRRPQRCSLAVARRPPSWSRVRLPRDTLSSHVIQADSLAFLQRLGVMDEILATGAGIVRRVDIRLEDARFVAPLPEREGDAGGAACIRGFILDPILADAAAAVDPSTGLLSEPGGADDGLVDPLRQPNQGLAGASAIKIACDLVNAKLWPWLGHSITVANLFLPRPTVRSTHTEHTGGVLSMRRTIRNLIQDRRAPGPASRRPAALTDRPGRPARTGPSGRRTRPPCWPPCASSTPGSAPRSGPSRPSSSCAPSRRPGR